MVAMSTVKNQKKIKKQERNLALHLFVSQYHGKNTIRDLNVHMGGKKKDKIEVRKVITTPRTKRDIHGEFGCTEKSHYMKNLWFCQRRKKYFPRAGMKFPKHKIVLFHTAKTFLNQWNIIKMLKSLGVKDSDLSKAKYKYHQMMKKLAGCDSFTKTLGMFLFYFPYCLTSVTATVRDPIGYICKLFDYNEYKKNSHNMRRRLVATMKKMGLVFHIDQNGVVWKVAKSFLLKIIKNFSPYLHFRTHSIFYFSSICKSGNQSIAIASHFSTHSPPICAEKIEHIKINRVNFTKNEEATQYQKYKLLKMFRTLIYAEIDSHNVHQKNGKIYNFFLISGTRLIRNVSKEYDFARLYKDCLQIIRESKTITKITVKKMITYFIDMMSNCLRSRQI